MMEMLLLLVGLSVSIVSSLGDTGCGGKPADVMFVLDSSASIGKEDFRRQITFTKDVVDMFDISQDRTRVAVTLFSSDVYPIFGLDTFADKGQLEKAIDKIEYEIGGTQTNKALKFMRESEFKKKPRKKVPQIAIVLTDGQSYDRNKTIQEAVLAHAAGITIFVIGIGAGVDEKELSALASDPDSSHLFHIGNYSALEKIKDTLAIKTCEVQYVRPTPAPTPAVIKPVDAADCTLELIVGVDTNGVSSRDTRSILSFVSEVTEALSSKPGKLRVSQLMTECADSSRKMPSKSYAPLIKKMRYQITRKSRLVKSAGILFINSDVDDVWLARSEVRRAMFGGFYLVVVTIGPDNQDVVVDLTGTSSSNLDVYSISRYSQLTSLSDTVATVLGASRKCG